jgi:hypothetical protein
MFLLTYFLSPLTSNPLRGYAIISQVNPSKTVCLVSQMQMLINLLYFLQTIGTCLDFLIRFCIFVPYIEQNLMILQRANWDISALSVGFWIFFFAVVQTFLKSISSNIIINKFNKIRIYFCNPKHTMKYTCQVYKNYCCTC